jgi:hypothetical protein
MAACSSGNGAASLSPGVDTENLRNDLIATDWMLTDYTVDGVPAGSDVTDCSKPSITLGTVWDFTNTGDPYGDLVVALNPCPGDVMFDGFKVDSDVLSVLLHENSTLDAWPSRT